MNRQLLLMLPLLACQLELSEFWTRLFASGTNYKGESYMVEWNGCQGVVKHYKGMAKDSVQLVIYETSASDLDIIRDISRTFPSHVFYQERHGPGQRSLYNILKAYSIYDRDVGYVQSCHIVIPFVMPCFNRSIIGSASDQFRTLVSLIDIGLRGLKALLRKGIRYYSPECAAIKGKSHITKKAL
ncbi:EVI5-like protein [Tanacetum coccineum]|uniref:EVI5-like protein n=1 Tax=Tanacetum coccineum TaxID=301880 RepID=A0ABQ4Z1N6_9ASTR